jgi:hypothetical protein
MKGSCQGDLAIAILKELLRQARYSGEVSTHSLGELKSPLR